MAKKKETVEEIMEPITDEVVEEVKPQKAEKKVDVDKFIARQLKVINEMPNKAKAKYLATRVLRNK